MATFTDPGGAEPNSFDPSGTLTDHDSASIDFGDGMPAVAGILSLSGNTFTVSAPHTYGEEGFYTIAVTIDHENTTPQVVTSTAVVSDPNVIATGGFTSTAVEGVAVTSQTVATFTDPGGAEPNAFDPSGTLTDHYSASINWGDNTQATAGVITLSGNTFTVSAVGHTFATPGNFVITVTIGHEDSQVQVVTSTAIVVAATGGFTFTAVEGAASAVQTVATFNNPGRVPPPPEVLASQFSASINWGDGQTTAGTLSLSGNTIIVSAGHTYGEEGTYPITTTININGLSPQVVTSTATVSDPSVVATGGFAFNAVTGVAAATQTVATFTDPGGIEPNAFDPSGTLTDHYSASINWGDGSPATPGVLSLSGNTIIVAREAILSHRRIPSSSR